MKENKTKFIQVWEIVLNQCFNLKARYLETFATYLSVQCRLGPLNAQDQVVIAGKKSNNNAFAFVKSLNVPIAVEGGNRLRSVFFAVVVDKSESLTLTCHLILGQENSRDIAEWFEKFLKNELPSDKNTS